MATILIDAEVYKVDDREALINGVYFGTTQPCLRSTSGNSYLEPQEALEHIKCRKYIRRYKVPLCRDDEFKDSPYKDKENILDIIGMSESVHNALGWHIDYVDKLETENDHLKLELKTANILIDEYKVALKMADLEHNMTKAELGVEKAYKDELQSLNLWGRIKYLITGAL